MTIPRMFAAGLDIVFPRDCLLCGSPLPPGVAAAPWPLCAGCALRLRPWSGARCEQCGLPLLSEMGRCMRCRGQKRDFDSVHPLFSYAGPVSELVSAYKKKNRRSLSLFFADIFASAILASWPDRTIVPVPPRPGKTRACGWDQVEEIAKALERRGFPVARPLERTRSEEQKSLGRGARGANANKAYALRTGASPPERPLLIDDVMTTCATLDACARALKDGGAASIEALVIAAD